MPKFQWMACCLLLIGCDAKTGSSANLPDVAIYPGATIISNGENSGVIGANLDIQGATEEQVRSFYVKELGLSSEAMQKGAPLNGKKNGHQIQIIITEFNGKVSVSIVEPKA